MEIENSTEANLAVLQLLRQQQTINISLRTAFDLAKYGDFVSIQVDQAKLDSLIATLDAMNADELRAFRRGLARKEITDSEQYPVPAFE